MSDLWDATQWWLAHPEEHSDVPEIALKDALNVIDVLQARITALYESLTWAIEQIEPGFVGPQCIKPGQWICENCNVEASTDDSLIHDPDCAWHKMMTLVEVD